MAVIPIPEIDWSGSSIVPLRLPSPSVEMCTRIRFLGWAPGSRAPSQAPTISGSPAAIIGSGMIANPGISVNPNQSPNDNARYLFMVDLLIELQPVLPFSDASLQPPQLSSSGCSSPPCKFCQNPPLWHPGYHKHTPDSGPPQLWQDVRSESDLKEFTRTVRAHF